MAFKAVALKINGPSIKNVYHQSVRKINFCLQSGRMCNFCLRVLFGNKVDQHFGVVAFYWHGLTLCVEKLRLEWQAGLQEYWLAHELILADTFPAFVSLKDDIASVLDDDVPSARLAS